MLKRFIVPSRSFSATALYLQDPVAAHHASTLHHHAPPPHEEEKEQYTPADFNTPFWKKTFLFTIGFTLLYKWNKGYEQRLKEKGQVHPITAYMSYYMPDQEESHRVIEEFLIRDQVNAAKRLLMFEDRYRKEPGPIVSP